MKSNLLKLSIVFLVVGLILTGVGFMAGATPQFTIDSRGIRVVNSEKVTVAVDELDSFKHVVIDVTTTDIQIQSGQSLSLNLSYHSESPIEYEVKEDTLYLRSPEQGRFGFQTNLGFFDSNADRIDLTLPEGMDLSDVTIANTVGSTSIQSLTAKTLTLNGRTGSTHLSDVSADSISAVASTGDIIAQSLKAKDLRLETTTGSVRIDQAAADEATLKATTGDIIADTCQITNADVRVSIGGIRLVGWSSDALSMQSTTGDIRIDGALGKETSIHSNVGSVTLNLDDPRDLYRTEFSTRVGDIHVRPDRANPNEALERHLQVSTSTGGINVKFIDG